MIDVPAWGWQLLTGAAAGLILGGAFGAWRMGRNAAQARQRASEHSRLMSVAPDLRQTNPGPEAALDPAVVRMIERLREQNRQLATQLREIKEAESHATTPAAARGNNADASSFDLGERCTSLERQLDEQRKAHAQELAQLMRTVLEQLDALQAAHTQQVQLLQSQLGPEADTLALRTAAQSVQQTARTAAAAFGRGGASSAL